jgi:hypothetical protein
MLKEIWLYKNSNYGYKGGSGLELSMGLNNYAFWYLSHKTNNIWDYY